LINRGRARAQCAGAKEVVWARAWRVVVWIWRLSCRVSTVGRKAFVKGLAKNEARELPDGVHDFQVEPQRPVLQHPVLRLLPCPHRDDHPGDLVHGKRGRAGGLAGVTAPCAGECACAGVRGVRADGEGVGLKVGCWVGRGRGGLGCFFLGCFHSEQSAGS
jgi:hypothetical protein